jgi:hypothetical protein
MLSSSSRLISACSEGFFKFEHIVQYFFHIKQPNKHPKELNTSSQLLNKSTSLVSSLSRKEKYSIARLTAITKGPIESRIQPELNLVDLIRLTNNYNSCKLQCNRNYKCVLCDHSKGFEVKLLKLKYSKNQRKIHLPTITHTEKH